MQTNGRRVDSGGEGGGGGTMVEIEGRARVCGRRIRASLMAERRLLPRHRFIISPTRIDDTLPRPEQQPPPFLALCTC